MNPKELVDFLIEKKCSFTDIEDIDEWEYRLQEEGDNEGLDFISKIGEVESVSDCILGPDERILFFKDHNFYLKEWSDYNQGLVEFNSCSYTIVEVTGERIVRVFKPTKELGSWNLED